MYSVCQDDGLLEKGGVGDLYAVFAVVDVLTGERVTEVVAVFVIARKDERMHGVDPRNLPAAGTVQMSLSIGGSMQIVAQIITGVLLSI